MNKNKRGRKEGWTAGTGKEGRGKETWKKESRK
jgi:hypothetical protein